MKMYNLLAFQEFYENCSQIEMNIEKAYKLNKILINCNSDLIFYQSELQKIFQDCIELDEQGQFKITEDKENYVLKPNKIEEFEKRINDLRNLEIDFDENNKIDISLFKDFKISPSLLYQIQDFLK